MEIFYTVTLGYMRLTVHGSYRHMVPSFLQVTYGFRLSVSAKSNTVAER